MNDRYPGAGELQYHLGELAYRVLDRIADVRRFGVPSLEELVNPFDLVIHVTEAARLGAVSVDRYRFAVQRLHDEVGDDASVARMHAGAVRVEDPNNARIEAVIAV